MKKVEDIIRHFESLWNSFLSRLEFHLRSGLSTQEYAFFEIKDLLVISLFVLISYLLKRKLLILAQCRPSETHCLHYLCNCQKWKFVSYDFSEFLTKVDISWQGLLWFVLIILVLIELVLFRAECDIILGILTAILCPFRWWQYTLTTLASP